MATKNIIDSQGEILNGTPLGTESVSPNTGLTSEKGSFKIDAKKLEAYPAGPKSELLGNVYTEDVLMPKSVYRVLGDDYHPEFDPEYNAKLLSTEQSNGGKFLSALNQAVVGQVIGGTISGFGYMLDLPMLFDLAEGTEQEFGNAVSRFGDKMSTWAEEATPVYTDPTAPKFNPSSFEWWMKNAPSVASTLSLVIPSMAGMKALQGISKLVGLTEKIGELGKFSKLFTTSLGQAIMSRHMENLMESRGVYDQGLKDAKDALYTKYGDQIQKELGAAKDEGEANSIENKWENVISQEAVKVAALGASNTYNKQWVMLLQDLPEYMLLNRFIGGKGKGAKTLSMAAAAEEKSAAVAKRLGANMPMWYTKNAVKQTLNALGEGGEEAFQFINEQQSAQMIRNLGDPDKKTTFTEELKNNWDNGDLWTNTFWGAMGAGFMQATMAGVNSKALAASNQARLKNLDEFAPLINKLHAAYAIAEDEGDEMGMEKAKKAFISAISLKAKRLGNKDHLLNMVDAFAKGDDDVLSSYETDKSDRDWFKGRTDIADDLKADINNVSNKFDEAFTYSKSKGLTDKESNDMAMRMAHSNFLLEFFNKKLAEHETIASTQQVPGYNVPNPENKQLSSVGKQKFELEYDKFYLQKKLNAVNKKLENKDALPADIEDWNKDKNYLEKAIAFKNDSIGILDKEKTVDKKQRDIDTELHGDLTKPEYNGTMPRGKDPEHPEIKGILDVIDTRKTITAYQENIDIFKRMLDQTRARVDEISASRKAKPADKKPTTPVKPVVEDKENLDISDNATYIGTDGQPGRGRVMHIEHATTDGEGKDNTPSAENIDNTVTIQPIDDKGEPVGDLVYVKGTTVQKESSDKKVDDTATKAEDSLEGDEIEMLPEGPKDWSDLADNLKDSYRRQSGSPLAGLIEFLSYTEYDDSIPKEARGRGVLRRLLVRDKSLNKFISNPANQKYLASAIATYSFDLNNEKFVKDINTAVEAKRLRSDQAHYILEFIKTGKRPKTNHRGDVLKESDWQKELASLMTLPEFVDLPIKIELTINGQTFKERLFMHTIYKTRQSLSINNKELGSLMSTYTSMRKQMITHLINGDQVYTQGLATSRGNPTNIDKTNDPSISQKDRAEKRKNNILDVFGLTYDNVELFILKSGTKTMDAKSYSRPKLFRDNDSPPEAMSYDFNSVGSVMIRTNRTVDGQWYAVKLNKSYISGEHAAIIFNAFSMLAKTELTKEGGFLPAGNRKFIGRYNAPIDPRVKKGTEAEESVLWNISIGEFLDLMVVHGEELTDPDSSRYKYVNEKNSMSEDHKRSLKLKRLFLRRGYGLDGKVDGIYLCYGLTKIKDKTTGEVTWGTPNVINTSKIGVQESVDYNMINLTELIKTPTQKTAHDAAVDDFMEWVQENKTYAVHLENRRLFQKLNGGFLGGKSFRIGKAGKRFHPGDSNNKQYSYTTAGEITRQKNESYVEFLIRNNFITTDIEERDGVIFDTPHVELGLSRNKGENYGIQVVKKDKELPDTTAIKENPKGTRRVVADKDNPATTIKVPKEEVIAPPVVEEKPPAAEEAQPAETKPKRTRTPKGKFDEKFREREDLTKVYEVQDLVEELRWLRKTLNLGKDEVEIEKDVAKMVFNGKNAWGVFSSAGMIIYEAAEKGTIYHEAFHKVNLAFHSKAEREMIYRAARQLYHMSKEEFTDNQVEEKLAEEFRDFVITKQKASQPSFIKRVFQRIYNFINALFFRAGSRLVQSDIDRLFNQIHSGKYRFAKTLKENKLIEPRLRSIMGEDFDTISTYEDITNMQKYLATRLYEVSGVQNLKSSRDFRFDKLVMEMEEDIMQLEYDLQDPNLPDARRNRYIKLLASLKDVLGEKDETGFYPKFTIFVKYINRYFSGLGVKKRNNKEEDDSIEDQGSRYDEWLSDEETSRVGGEYGMEDFFHSLQDGTLASVKFFINTLHESSDWNERTGYRTFVDGNFVWYKLLNDIAQYDNVSEMINEIRRIGEYDNYYPYMELADKLEDATEEFRTQFQISFEVYKHVHLLVQFTRAEGKDNKEINMSFDSATREQLSRTTVLKWNELMQADRSVIGLPGTKFGDSTITARNKDVNTKFFEELLKEFDEKVTGFYDDKVKDGPLISDKDVDTLFKRASKMLDKIHISIKPDVLRHYATNLSDKELNKNLYKFVRNLRSLMGQEIVLDNEGDIIQYMKNTIILSLSEAYANVNKHEEADMVVGPEGHMIWRYGKLNLPTSYLRKIKKDSKWAEGRRNSVGKKGSRILSSFVPKSDSEEDVATASAYRDKFGLMTMSSFKRQSNYASSSRDYLHLTRQEDYLFKAYSILEGKMLPFPVMADRGGYFEMIGADLIGISEGDMTSNVITSLTPEGDVVFTDDVINAFYKYYEDEKEIIDAALEVRKTYREGVELFKKENAKPDADKAYLKAYSRDLRSKLIKNYHYGFDKNGKMDLNLGNAYNFIHFKGFEKYKTVEEIRVGIGQLLNDRLKDEIKFTLKHDIIGSNPSKETPGGILYHNILLSSKYTEANEDILVKNFGIISALSQILVNTQIGVMESEKLFLADHAQFQRNSKDPDNFDTYEQVYKRWFGVGGTGTKLRVNIPGRRTSYNASTLNTQKFKSPVFDLLVPKHEELYREMLMSKLSKEELKDELKLASVKVLARDLAEKRLSKYENVDSTDGGAFISPEMFYEISDRLGMWSDRKQKAFDLLNSDEKLTAAQILAASNIIFNPLKTMYIGHHDFNGVDMLVYNKMAMFTLFRQHVKGTHLEEVLDRMETKGKYADKKLEKIHVYNFDTAVKVGGLMGMDLFTSATKRNEVSDLSGSLVFKQSFGNLSHQQVIDPHNGMSQTFGTAGFKIASADVIKDSKYSDFGTGEELLDALHYARATLSDFGIHRVDATFGMSNGKISNKAFLDILRDAAEGANKSFDFQQALRIEENGEKYLEIDSFNDRKWIYARIKTIVDELTVDLNTPGNQLVQMSDYGMNKTASYTEELNFTRSEVKAEGSEEPTKVYEMECRVSIRLFKNFFPHGHIITQPEIQMLLDSSPQLFGYRVPTQGQNSLVRLRVVDLLPEQAGDIIQLPLEFTALTGSDFDIDKLYVAMHNYISETDKQGNIKLSKIAYSTSEKEAQSRWNNKVLELYDIYKDSIESLRGMSTQDVTISILSIIDKYYGKITNHGTYKQRHPEEESIGNTPIGDSLSAEQVEALRNLGRENQNIPDDIGTVDSTENAERGTYLNERLNLLARIASIEKKIADKSGNEIYKEHLQQDLRQARGKLNKMVDESNVVPKNNLMSEFISEFDLKVLGDYFVKSGKILSLEEFSKLPLEQQNTTKALQNRLLDLMMTILGDEKHFVNSTTPLGVMNDVLYAKKDFYTKAYNPSEYTSAPGLYTTTPSFQSAMKEKFSAAKFGIAPYALGNNHHALTQMAGVIMQESKLDLGFNKKGEIDLSRVTGEDGMYITWWISALIDIHVDGVNKPIATSLNINEATHDMVNFLIRAGLGDTTFDFINQPVMRDYSHSYFNVNKKYGKDSNRISTIDSTDELRDLNEKWKYTLLNEGVLTEEQFDAFDKSYKIPLPQLLNKAQLRADAIESTKPNKSKAYYIRQYSISRYLEDLKKDSNDLRSFVLACRVDTKKYGANPVEIFHFLDTIYNVMHNSSLPPVDGKRGSRFKNIERILTTDKNYKYKKGDTFLPTIIRNSMYKIYDLLKNDSIYATRGFNMILNDMIDSTRNGDFVRKSMINTTMEELMTYFIGKFFSDPVDGLGLTTNDVRHLIVELDNKDSIYETLLKLKTPNDPLYEEVKNNPLLNTLIVDLSDAILEDRAGEPIPYMYIKTPYRSKSNELTKEELQEGFKDLFSSPNERLRDLAMSLYIYSFYTSGFRQRLTSFSSYIPIYMNKEFKYKGKVVSLNEHMKKILNKLSTEYGYLEYLAEAKREVFTNMWDTEGYAFAIDDYIGKENGIKVLKNFSDENSDSLGIKIKTEGKTVLSRMSLGVNARKENIFVPYIKFASNLYEYMGYDKADGSMYYVSVSKKGLGSNGHGSKGLFIYETGLGSIDDRLPNESMLGKTSNNPTRSGATVRAKKDRIIKNGIAIVNANLLNFVEVPLENQIVADKYASLATTFFDKDESDADILRRQDQLAAVELKRMNDQDKLRKNAFDTATASDFNVNDNLSIESDTEELFPGEDPANRAAKKHTSNLKASKDNMTTEENPIIISIDGSSKGEQNNHVLGVGAYSKFGDKEYFLYRDDSSIRGMIDRLAGSRGVKVPEDMSNGIAEVYALLSVMATFKDTSENILIESDNELALYLFKDHMINPGDKPIKTAGNPIIKILHELITKYINQLESNGGSVKLRYIKTKSTANSKIVDKVAKGEHKINIEHNDFKDEKWGVPIKFTPAPIINVNKEFTGHSGGAPGTSKVGSEARWSSDLIWEDEGTDHGVNWENFSFKGHNHGSRKTTDVRQIESLPVSSVDKAKLEYAKAAAQLGKNVANKEYTYKLMLRNWFQVKSSDGIYAIGRLDLGKGQVDGGTGYAVQMAINNNKLLFVYDLQSRRWYKYDYVSDKFMHYAATPILVKNFAGIGTRGSASGDSLMDKETYDLIKSVVKAVYDKTFGESKPVDPKVSPPEANKSNETNKTCL